MLIVAKITSLLQYSEVIKKNFRIIRPDYCQLCSRRGVWLHGCYSRKADRVNSTDSLNPIWIQRYFCPDCRKTFSALPECIPPRRWYLWDVQQAVLLLVLAGKSLRFIANKVTPSRHTIKRWFNRFQEQFSLHKDTLCNHFIELGRAVDFSDFWLVCFKKISLAEVMRLCHTSGVPVP